MMTDYEYLLYELKDDIAFIRLNNPDTLNSMTREMGQELTAALTRAEGEARAIILGSVGRAFSSGANLSADGGFDITDPERDAGIGLERIFNGLIRQLRDLKVPLVTAVRGPSVGVSCGISLMGDIIIAGENAYFLQSFSKIGLVPDGAGAYLLARAIGRVRAMEMMLLAERYPATKAYEHGLITRLVKDEDVDATALEIAKSLALGPASLALTRRSAWHALDATLDEQLDFEREYQRKAGRTDDFAEGVTAFREKRPPAFKGK